MEEEIRKRLSETVYGPFITGPDREANNRESSKIVATTVRQGEACLVVTLDPEKKKREIRDALEQLLADSPNVGMMGVVFSTPELFKGGPHQMMTAIPMPCTTRADRERMGRMDGNDLVNAMRINI